MKLVLLKRKGSTVSNENLGKFTYSPTTLMKEEILVNQKSVFIPMAFQPKMTNCIVRHS